MLHVSYTSLCDYISLLSSTTLVSPAACKMWQTWMLHEGRKNMSPLAFYACCCSPPSCCLPHCLRATPCVCLPLCSLPCGLLLPSSFSDAFPLSLCLPPPSLPPRDSHSPPFSLYLSPISPPTCYLLPLPLVTFGIDIIMAWSTTIYHLFLSYSCLEKFSFFPPLHKKIFKKHETDKQGSMHFLYTFYASVLPFAAFCVCNMHTSYLLTDRHFLYIQKAWHGMHA